MLFRMLPERSIARRLACALFALCMGLSSAALAQDVRLPLDEVSLQDLDGFRATGNNWRIVGRAAASLDTEALETSPGAGVLANVTEPGQGANLFTEWNHGDLDLELDYLMPRGSNSGIYFQGRYEIQLYDSWSQGEPTFTDAGGIYERWDPERGAGYEGFEGVPPRYNVQRAPGLWNHLRITFRAPRFDEQGNKADDARFVRVEHNGVVIHENVRLTGPTRAAAFSDEAPMGPLMIQGDHGPVAFRNLRIKRYGNDLIELSDVRYELREGAFEGVTDYADLAPIREGASDGFDAGVGGLEDQFALTFSGTMEIPASGPYRFGLTMKWIDDDPHFTGATRGGGILSVDGKEVLVHDGREATAVGSVALTEGSVPFELTYFKNRPWSPPEVELSVDGAGVPFHLLNNPHTLPDPPDVSRILVDVATEPVVQRSFVYLGDKKYVDAVNVANPSGVHYAYDLSSGSLLHVWRGAFVDATPMWHSRGNDQVALPLGMQISPAPPPSLVDRDGDAEAQRDYTFIEYRLDEAGRPRFHYVVDGLAVVDAIHPVEVANGVVLRRELETSGAAPSTLELRLATGDSINRQPSGRYDVDGRFIIETDGDAAVRSRGDGKELVLPVDAGGGRSDISYTIIF